LLCAPHRSFSLLFVHPQKEAGRSTTMKQNS